ncbi:Os03g0311100 [Oryza sativa Japonica Group]|uniref:Os03g0311100 protein n=1 Tax=Oryza sativa subsp. japonica TaxID=39947 RepID=A0A0P0VXD0_ORYSJ|nr:Os03g0311100 [Oryza sativa Japonica Group]
MGVGDGGALARRALETTGHLRGGHWRRRGTCEEGIGDGGAAVRWARGGVSSIPRAGARACSGNGWVCSRQRHSDGRLTVQAPVVVKQVPERRNSRRVARGHRRSP